MHWFRLSAIAALFLGSIYVLLPTILQEDPQSRLAEQAGSVATTGPVAAPDLDVHFDVEGEVPAAADAIAARLSAFGVGVERARPDGDRVRVVLTPGTSRESVIGAVAPRGVVTTHRLEDVAAALGWTGPVEPEPALSVELGAALAAVGGGSTSVAGAALGEVPPAASVGTAVGEGTLRLPLSSPLESPAAFVVALDGVGVALGYGQSELVLAPLWSDPAVPAILAAGPLPPGIVPEAEQADAAEEGPAVAAAVDEPSRVPDWLRAILPDTRMNLGIDLQGGLDLTLQVELDQAVLSQASRDTSFLKEQAARDGVDIGTVEVDSVDPILYITSATPLAELTRWFARNLPDYEYVESRDEVHAYQMTDTRIADVHDQSVDQVLETLRKRVDATGVKEPSIVKKSGGRISVQLPGAVDLEAAIDAIGTTAVLEFQLVDEEFSLSELRRHVRAAEESLPADQFAHDATVNQWLWREGRVPTDREVLFDYQDTTEGTVRDQPYIVMREVMLTGADINDASVAWDNNQQPYVRLEMKPRGGQVFCRVTSDHVNDRFAIVLDDQVQSTPVIRDRICGGVASIEMGSSMDALNDANSLALVLRTGSLNAPVSLGEVRNVGSLLGSDAIRSGTVATGIGASLVLLFMGLWYRKAGLIADVALVLNVLLVLATLALFGATLTLPGIAGIALTVGMAVDANIIIYERVREELLLGQHARKAVDAGFEKGLSAILDANITTAIAGIVLYSYGTGPIKGFAVTLLVGIATTLITALFVSRTFMELSTRSSSARLRI